MRPSKPVILSTLDGHASNASPGTKAHQQWKGMTMQILHDGRGAPKQMARVLRERLQSRDVKISHSECLEIVAAQLGARDWNTLSARDGKDSEADKALTIPVGWLRSGLREDLYSIGVDPDVFCEGRPSVVIRYAGSPPSGLSSPKIFACLFQAFAAENYRGHRLKLYAHLKAADISQSGTIWMRVDDKEGQIVAFDNMEMREIDSSLKGTTDWVERNIVLDVPATATSIFIGFYLAGTGALWCADMNVASVADSVEPTARVIPRAAPENIDFQTSRGPAYRGYGYARKGVKLRFEQI